MQISVPTYIQLIAEHYPAVICHSPGNGSVYEDIVHQGGDSLPSKIELDNLLLSTCKEKAKAEVNVYRKDWMNDYFTYDFLQWDCDDEAVTNITGTLLVGLVGGNALPPGFLWRDKNNVDHEVDFMYMVNMAVTVMTFKKQVYAMSWVHKATIDSLPTLQHLLDYDHTVGWPSRDA